MMLMGKGLGSSYNIRLYIMSDSKDSSRLKKISARDIIFKHLIYNHKMQEHMSSSLAETIQIQAAYFQLRRAR